jgi:hypothetical protein
MQDPEKTWFFLALKVKSTILKWTKNFFKHIFGLCVLNNMQTRYAHDFKFQKRFSTKLEHEFMNDLKAKLWVYFFEEVRKK